MRQKKKESDTQKEREGGVRDREKEMEREGERRVRSTKRASERASERVRECDVQSGSLSFGT